MSVGISDAGFRRIFFTGAGAGAGAGAAGADAKDFSTLNSRSSRDPSGFDPMFRVNLPQ